MMQVFTYWKMAWLRALLYASIVGGSTAMALSETWSDATWQGMGVFLRFRFFTAVFLAAGGAVLAFIDQTMGQLRNGQAAPPVKVQLPEDTNPPPAPPPKALTIVPLIALLCALSLGTGCTTCKAVYGLFHDSSKGQGGE